MSREGEFQSAELRELSIYGISDCSFTCQTDWPLHPGEVAGIFTLNLMGVLAPV